LSFAAPKTKEVVKVLKALDADRSVLIATQGLDRNAWLGGRNIRKAVIKPAAEINAYDVLSARSMVISKAAFEDVLKTCKPSKVNAEKTAAKA
jgi:large subunit ribosomal protein L4